MFFRGGHPIGDAGTIIYEDSSIVVLNKSPGILSHALPRSERGISAEEQVRDAIQKRVDKTLKMEPSLHLNHRLDFETSGVLLFTRGKINAYKLSKAIERKKDVRKKYRAIVSGKVKEEEGIIVSGIIVPKNGERCYTDRDGKLSETHYKIVDQRGIVLGNTRILLSELELEIKTGRRHQIRVHCSSSGFPIIGDRLYGNHQRNELIRREFGLKRQALHAENYVIEESVLGKKYDLKAAIPEDIGQVINFISSGE